MADVDVTPKPDAQPTEVKTEAQADAKPERSFSQDEVSKLVARERGKVERTAQAQAKELEELRGTLAKLQEEQARAAEAAMTEGQRAEARAKREREKLEGELTTHRTRAEQERTKRHDRELRYEASSRVSALAAGFFSPALVGDVTELVRGALSIEDGPDGTERTLIRLPDGTVEPLTDETWKLFSEKRLVHYLRADGGSGSPHGAGNGPARRGVDLSKMTSLEKIELGVAMRQKR